MNMNRLSALAVCFAMSLAVIAAPVEAKDKGQKNKKHDKKQHDYGKGYPNGRGWEAVEYDFKIVKNKLDVIDDKVDYIADDVYMLKNALQVQVRVETIKAEASINLPYQPIVMFVQVIQNGKGVTKLTADDFRYMNSFPEDAAKYCGDQCFSEGKAGQYAIMLEGDWNPGVFAGTLEVHTEYDDMTSYGTSQVVFDIPEAPLKP